MPSPSLRSVTTTRGVLWFSARGRLRFDFVSLKRDLLTTSLYEGNDRDIRSSGCAIAIPCTLYYAYAEDVFVT